MASIDRHTHEIHCQVVYYGPAASGKSTSLRYIAAHIQAIDKPSFNFYRGKHIGTYRGNFLLPFPYSTQYAGIRYFVSSVLGVNLYDHERTALLKHADGVIFVADIQKHKMRENIRFYQEVIQGLRSRHLHPKDFPFVWQYNKQDLPELHRFDTAMMNHYLNFYQRPCVESVALKHLSPETPWKTGDGVLQAFELVHQQIVERLLIAPPSENLAARIRAWFQSRRKL